MKHAIVITIISTALASVLGLLSLSGIVSNIPSQKTILAPAPGSPMAVAGGPGNIAIGDLNKDGKPDLVVASGRARSITVLLGQGDGQFRAAGSSPISVPDSPTEMVLGEVNGDDKLDLVIASHDSYRVILLFGDGNGRLSLSPNSPIIMKDGRRPHTHGLGIGDLNGDGKLDLVTANNEDHDLALVFGDGRGGFTRAPGSPFAVEKGPYPLTLGDLNDDRHLDIVSTSTLHGHGESGQALTVLFGDGRGSFRRGRVEMRTVNPWYVAIGDLNGDRKQDLVTTHWERNELTVILGDGRGGFAETTGSPFNLGHSAWRVAIEDFNRDGKTDVAAAAGDGVRLMLGDGRGSFKPAQGSPFQTGKGVWQLAVGDVNEDSKPDIATSNLETDNVTVLIAR
jgi:FG-GAP-like repeat